MFVDKVVLLYYLIVQFSWWGAWLSDSDKVVAPSGWFAGSNNEQMDTSDIVPKSWRVV